MHWCGTVKGIIWFLWLLTQVCSREMKKVFQRESSCNFIQLPTHYFGENNLNRSLSLTINITMTKKGREIVFIFQAALSRAKSKLSVRLDKLGMLAGTSQNAHRILIFSFAMSAISIELEFSRVKIICKILFNLEKISVTWNPISLFTQLYWSAKVIHFNLGNGATVQLFFCMWHNSSWLLFIDIIMALDLFSRAAMG